jgi:aspartate beta-hydroxylase
VSPVQLCSKTCAILKSAPEVAGTAESEHWGGDHEPLWGNCGFVRLAAGVHVRPHFGASNRRLTAVLPLVVDDKFDPAVGRVGPDGEQREFKHKQALVLDDSFEQEVWHNGSKPYYGFVCSFWHPALLNAHEYAPELYPDAGKL